MYGQVDKCVMQAKTESRDIRTSSSLSSSSLEDSLLLLSGSFTGSGFFFLSFFSFLVSTTLTWFCRKRDVEMRKMA